jgi:hypothetical protein
MSGTALRTAVKLVNSGKKVPLISLVRDSSELAAVASKLIAPKEDRTQHDNRGDRVIDPTSLGTLSAISRSIARKSKDAAAMLQMFPETELAAQILISSVISPKDMTKGDINIVAGKKLKSDTLNAKLLEVLVDYFADDYKIKPMLPKILRNVLINDGSDPYVVIPENSIDDLINGSSRISLESLSDYIDLNTNTFKHIGILGNPTETATLRTPQNIVMESHSHRGGFKQAYDPKITLKNPVGGKSFDTKIVVIDNPFVLKFPQVITKNANISVEEAISGARMGKHRQEQEYVLKTNKTTSRFSDRELTSLFYKKRYNTQVPFVKVRTDSEMARSTIGKPLVLKLPAEAVIPVFTPGNEEEHVGYFLLLEPDGTPVTGMANTAYEEALQSRLGGTGTDMSSYLLQRSKEALYGRDCVPGDQGASKRIFMDIIESDLLARLRNGAIGKKVSIARNEDIYNLMLARHFANQMTQLLYVPKDLLTYFVYKVDERGIGRSMLDDTAILNSLRAMVLFAKVQNQTKNSIGSTIVDIELDPDDPDPDKTVAIAQHETARLRQADFPVGITAINDIAEWTARANILFNVSGHPGVPAMKMTYSEGSRSNPLPDSDLEETLRKRTIMTMGLSPETVEAGVNANFSRSVVLDNILFAKRVIQIQEKIVPQFTEHLRKVAINDGNIRDRMMEIVSDNYEDVIKELVADDDALAELKTSKETVIRLLVSEFLSTFEAELPSADFTTIENQAEALASYEEIVDKVVSYYIDSQTNNEVLSGKVSAQMDNMKVVMKAAIMRNYLRDNNILTELTDILGVNVDNKLIDQFTKDQADHINKITRMAIVLLQNTSPVANAADKDIENITGSSELGGGGYGGGDFGGGGDSGGGSDDFGFGGDDFGGNDLGSSTTDEPPSSEEEEETKSVTDGSDVAKDGGELGSLSNVENPE